MMMMKLFYCVGTDPFAPVFNLATWLNKIIDNLDSGADKSCCMCEVLMSVKKCGLIRALHQCLTTCLEVIL